MKLAIGLSGLLVGGLMIFSDPVADIGGTWVSQTGVAPVTTSVLRMQLVDGTWRGIIDIPDQELFDKPVTHISLKKDSFFIRFYPEGPLWQAVVIGDSLILGSTEEAGRADTFRFRRIKNQG